ncbi:MAG: hypothetical protein PHC50_07745 [Candidatus Cloacimonetes bacterium]|nr:hypothetical protein [Candidatus Cloacimonadota bacterium]
MSFLWNSCGCASAGLSELAIAGRSDILSYIKNKTCAKMPHLQFLESRFSVLDAFDAFGGNKNPWYPSKSVDKKS